MFLALARASARSYDNMLPVEERNQNPVSERSTLPTSSVDEAGFCSSADGTDLLRCGYSCMFFVWARTSARSEGSMLLMEERSQMPILSAAPLLLRLRTRPAFVVRLTVSIC